MVSESRSVNSSIARPRVRQKRSFLLCFVKRFRICTYEKSSCNPFAINTYENAGLKVEQNQHLQKKWGVGAEPPASEAKSPARGASPVRKSGVLSAVSPARMVSATEERGACAVSKLPPLSRRCSRSAGLGSHGEGGK